MKIVDRIRGQISCAFCTAFNWDQRTKYGWCDVHDEDRVKTYGCTSGSWYLELTTPPNRELIGDKPHKVVYVHDFGSWLNLYQCPRPPQIRVLSRDEWPEVEE